MVRIVKRLIQIVREDGIRGIYIAARRLVHRRRIASQYDRWIRLYDTLGDTDLALLKDRNRQLEGRPLISIVMPVYNVDHRYLVEALDSVRRQIYENWELCIADDHSSQPHVREVLEEYERLDDRIKVVFRDTNGHISEASNSALELVDGEFVALMDHDDVLAEDALYHVAAAINDHRDAGLIYSDEDKIDAHGNRYSPMFKPDWAPETLYSHNFLTHLSVFRTSVIREVGGFRLGYEGSQDYDLALRVVERTRHEAVIHIPHVLYHWRAIPGSVAFDSGEKTYAHDRARSAITDHFERTGINARSIKGKVELHRPVFAIDDKIEVSIVIGPGIVTRDILTTIVEKARRPIREIVISDGAAVSSAVGANVVQVLQEGSSRFEWMNRAVARSQAELIVFIDPATKSVSDDWLNEVAGRASIKEIGVVGAKIVNRANRIIHAGYILGVGTGVGRSHFGTPGDEIGAFVRLWSDYNYSAVSVASMSIRRDVFTELGGFDADAFPNVYADIDLCLRLGTRGLRTLWTPWATFVQDRPEGLPDDEQLTELRRRWETAFACDPYYNPNLTLRSEDLSFAFPPRVSRKS